MTSKIFLKLIAAGLLVLVIALVTVDFAALRVIEANYYETLERLMGEKARTVASVAGQRTVHELAEATSARVTIVGRDGRVLGDSARSDVTENHGSRPEIQAALAGRQGSAIRESVTTGIKTLYVAIPIDAGALRVALPLATVESQISTIRKRLSAATAIAFLPALLLAGILARSVSSKLGSIIDYAGELARGNFKAELIRQGRGELGVLSSTLSATGQKLQGSAEALEREHAELEKLERVRKDFVINVSHELRTPLASIQGYCETLLDGAIHDPENNTRFLHIIRQNAERLANLAADLVTLSRIELKQRQLNLQSWPASHLLRDAADSVRPLAAKKKIVLIVSGPTLPAEVNCDHEAVHQILMNLIDNALKYTPEGGQILLAAAAAGDMVRFSVRDTGSGILEEEQSRLFERFYRVDKARSRQLGGTGLGLAIVKHLVLAHGGDVRVESAPGKGSAFSFTLPTSADAPMSPVQREEILTS